LDVGKEGRRVAEYYEYKLRIGQMQINFNLFSAHFVLVPVTNSKMLIRITMNTKWDAVYRYTIAVKTGLTVQQTALVNKKN
jgi:hypothetical protein